MNMNRKTSIELSKDGKSSMYILTKIDSEGFHHSIFVSKEELVEILKLINMLYYKKDLFSKDNEIVQRIAVKNCTASIEVLNEMLKKFPFNAYVVRSGDNEKDKETVIYIHLGHIVSLRTVDGLAEIIEEVIYKCDQISGTLKEFEDSIDALVKDCKPFENETTKSNSSTAKKVSD